MKPVSQTGHPHSFLKPWNQWIRSDLLSKEHDGLMCWMVLVLLLAQHHTQRIVHAEWQPPQELISADFHPILDRFQCLWDIDATGRVKHGTQNCFSGGASLRVDGSLLTSEKQLMSVNGDQYLLLMKWSGLQIRRHISFDRTNGWVRYIDSFQNLGTEARRTKISIRTTLGRKKTSTLLTNTGLKNPGKLDRFSAGLLAYNPQPEGQTSVLIYAQGAGGSQIPIFSHVGNYDFTFSYELNIPPGKTHSIIHGLAQRRLFHLPHQWELKQLFAPALSGKFTSDLTADLKATLVNYRDWDAEHVHENLLENLTEQWRHDFQVPPAAHDTLILGKGTRLLGETFCKELTIETKWGTVPLVSHSLWGIRTSGDEPDSQTVYLRSGQIIKGKINAKECFFLMNTGLSLALDLSRIDQLVFHDAEPALPREPHAGIVTFATGERLTLQREVQSQLELQTKWGKTMVSLEDLDLLKHAEKNSAFDLRFKNGSRLTGTLSQTSLKLPISLVGEQSIPLSSLQSFHGNHTSNGDGDNTALHTAGQLKLQGRNVLKGELAGNALHLIVDDQKEELPVPSSQIRMMYRAGHTSETKPETKPETTWTVQLWSGEVLTGQFKEDVIHFNQQEETFDVPINDIVSFENPSPVLSQTMQRRIQSWIQDLGSENYRKRQNAQEALKDLGEMTRAELEYAWKNTADPEVKRRVDTLLKLLP